MTGPDAVLFDLDGTLVDTETESGEAVCRVFARRYGIDPGDAAREAVVGASWDELLGRLLSDLGLEEPDRPGLRRELLAAKAALVRGRLPELPGARRTLRAAVEAFPVGVVTGSWRDDAELVLGAFGVLDRVGVVVSSDDVVEGKPSPEGYLLATRALGARPGRCLAFEDSQRGLAAALAAGVVVVAVRAGSYTPDGLDAADAVIDSLEGLDASGLTALFRRGLAGALARRPAPRDARHR